MINGSSYRKFKFSNDIISDLKVLFELYNVTPGAVTPETIDFVIFLANVVIDRYHVTNEELISIYKNYTERDASIKENRKTTGKILNQLANQANKKQEKHKASEEKKEAIAEEIAKFLVTTGEKLRNSEIGEGVNEFERKIRNVMSKDSKFLENLFNDIVKSKK